MSADLDDPVSRAARALRDELSDGDSGGHDPSGGATRTRVLGTVARRGRRRHTLRAAASAILLVALVPAAWAATGGEPFSRLWQAVARRSAGRGGDRGAASTVSPGVTPAIAPATMATAVAGAAPSPPPVAPAVVGAESYPPRSAPVVVTHEHRDRVTAERVAVKRADTAAEGPEEKAPPAAVPVADAAGELYREAHRAHFVAHDPGAALAGWDRYLAAAPTGEFAPEASYNRALSLIRLGRRDEARAALRPFADGRMGDYRRREASALLHALDGKSAPSGSPAQ